MLVAITVVLVATTLLGLMSHSTRWLGFGAAVLLCLCYPLATCLLLLTSAAILLVIHFSKRKTNRAFPKLPHSGP